MKKINASLLVIAAIIFGFSSCTKCYTCDFGANGGQQKICSKDFPDKGAVKRNQDLKNTIDAYQKNGYVCVAN